MIKIIEITEKKSKYNKIKIEMTIQKYIIKNKNDEKSKWRNNYNINSMVVPLQKFIIKKIKSRIIYVFKLKAQQSNF